MITTTYKSNVANFLASLRLVSEKALVDMAALGVQNIKSETPVITGHLKESNKADVKDKSIYFTNEAKYAAYVELGTFLQSSNPYMRRGINKSRQEFLRILVNNLKSPFKK